MFSFDTKCSIIELTVSTPQN